MKLLSLLAVSWMLVAACLAQEAPAKSPKSPAETKPLAENVTIHVRGIPSEESPVDLQLSGVGPQFKYNGFKSDTNDIAPTMVRFDASLAASEDGKVIVQYFIGASVPIQTSAAGANYSISYKDTGLEGRAVVAYGEAVKIASINGKDCILSVTKYAKSQK